jgi:hypothetical protein
MIFIIIENLFYSLLSQVNDIIIECSDGTRTRRQEPFKSHSRPLHRAKAYFLNSLSLCTYLHSTQDDFITQPF